MQHLVLLGGGHAHALVLKQLVESPAPAGLAMTVICREVETPYSGMLPGLLAGHYRREDCHIDLGPLCRAAGVRLLDAEADGLDIANRLVRLKGRPPVPFDLLSVNSGATPSFNSVAGAEQYALPVKPVTQFLERWEKIEADLLAGNGRNIVLVGGGAGGFEVILALRYRLQMRMISQPGDFARLTFTLVASSSDVLPTHPAPVRRRARQALDRSSVSLRLGQGVTRVTANQLHLADGSEIQFDHCLWATGVTPAPWIAASGLATDERGFIAIDDNLRSTSHDYVFAAGDVAAMQGHKLAKAGVYAVRQGPVLATNLVNAAQGKSLIPYRPQRDFLTLITTGPEHAIACRAPFHTEGDWVWRWKRRIDTRFMAMLDMGQRMASSQMAQPKPVMPDVGTLAARMRCGGCGAKIGADVLSRALASLDAGTNPDIRIGLNQPDDASVIVPPPGKALVQSVDFFRALVDDPFTFGRIAAQHCLGDLFAMGAEPHSALAIVTLPHAAERQQEMIVGQLLAGALSVLRSAGAALIGGHTAEGAELAFGLSLNGFVDETAISRKGGLKDGDAIILTTALGTGAAFAAAMAGVIRSGELQPALAQMQRGQQQASQILRAHGASALTDVTGFGLVGHLLEMLRASKMDAELDIAKVPMLAAGLKALQLGHASTAMPQNLKAGALVDNRSRFEQTDPKILMLYDPQTAGGLLAGVSAYRVEACLRELREAGFGEAVAIGHTTERAGSDALITLGDG